VRVRSGGLSWGAREGSTGAGLHAWVRRRVASLAVRADGWAPRAGGSRLAIEAGPEAATGGVRWSARMRVRSEEAALGLLTGVSVTGDVLGVTCRLRVDHAAATPGWTAVYLGGGSVQPVRLVEGQRLTALTARRGPIVVRVFEAASGSAERRRRGISVALESRGSGR
jgi:hypothetical protein